MPFSSNNKTILFCQVEILLLLPIFMLVFQTVTLFYVSSIHFFSLQEGKSRLFRNGGKWIKTFSRLGQRVDILEGID